MLSDESPIINENKIKLDPMSDEQRVIYEYIKSGNNVVVDACAGSGKSTTILSIATCIPDREFIQLTYNSMLCAEIKTKADQLGLSNIRIYTYHSLAVKYYSNNGYTDTMIRRVLNHNMPPRISIPRTHVIVIDETQDMTMLYFKLVVKFCKDHGHPIQLLILGDFMQGLYEFKGADTRFLTNAPEIWNSFPLLSSSIFIKCSLKMSYRITQEMADFVNDVMLGEKRLLACKNGPPVVYLRRSVYNAEKYVVYQIKKMLREGASPSDFFVLGGSVKGDKSAIRKMENALVENDIPCHVPMMDTDKIDERVINGKVVFSTFHSVKGRQRKYVFVMGFDQSYFKYFARNLDPYICPNTLYVACTRATHGLVVIENHNRHDDRPLTFLKMSHTEIQKHPSIDFKGMPQTVFHDNDENDSMQNVAKHYVTPTELIKFIPEHIIEKILPIIEKIFIKVNDETTESMIEIPTIIETKSNFHEDVSDLNGIAIPLMYFDKMLNKSAKQIQCGGDMLHQIIQSDLENIKQNEHSFLRKIVSNLPKTCTNVADYLYLSNVFVAVREKLYFKVRQIPEDEYTWLSEDIINECFERIHNVLYCECISEEQDFNIEIEKTIIHASDDQIHSRIDKCLTEYFPNKLFRFTGRVDAITEKCVWEIKCVGELTNDHFLQVVIYAWIWRFCVEDIENLENIRDFRIFNIRSGEIYRLEAETHELTQIMIELLKGKYGSPENADNYEFIEQCKTFL
jgi:hypothetical protein